MGKDLVATSLLPWLNREESRVYLEIPMRHCEEGQGLPPQPYILGTTVLTRLLDARFVTQAGSTLKHVFLLTERESYSLPAGSAQGFGNRDIDKLWESFYSDRSNDATLIFLEKQFRDKVFKSIFYCGERKSYFHPWCPQCGALLDQCNEDELLSAAFLPAPASSLRRFLYCRDCCTSSANPDFYCFEREESDPHWVLDRWTLVRKYRQKHPSRGAGEGLSCWECPHHVDCFGPESLVNSRLYPLFFYNFHLAVLEPAQFPARDFLAVVSGASFAEIPGNSQVNRVTRNGPIHLFNASEKLFSEILYLKTIFLYQVSSQFLCGPRPVPDVDLSQFWVETPDCNGLLPFIWNFRVRPMEIHHVPLESKPLSPPQSLFLHNLAILWIDALLGSKTKDLKGIFDKFAEVPACFSRGETSFSSETLKLFPPEENYWEASGLPISESDRALWQEALCYAGRLFFYSYHYSPDWSPGDFLAGVESFASKIKHRLFQGVVTPSLSQTQRPAEVIQKVLLGILEKWQGQLEKDFTVPPEAPGETVIISGQASRRAPVSVGSTQEAPLEETVIISRMPQAAAASQEVMPRQSTVEDTVILKPGTFRPGQAFPPGPAVGDKSETECGGLAASGLDEDETLHATLILTPDELKRLRKDQ